MIYHLLYRSFSRGSVSESQIEAILKKSQENNLKFSVSGILLYKDRIFLQVLEGEEKVVLKTYEKIAKDDRHIFPEVLITTTSENRIFGEWNMGLIESSRIEKPLGSVSNLVSLAATHGRVDENLILSYLKYFVRGDIQSKPEKQ